MHEGLLDSTTYIDLEKTARYRSEPWARNTVVNVLNYRTDHGKPFLSIVTVVEIL